MTRERQSNKPLRRNQPSHPNIATGGHPQDVIQYFEAKLILKPEPLHLGPERCTTSAGSCRRTRQKSRRRLHPRRRPRSLRPQIREIVFFDTPDFRLYNNAFILRRRISYVDGFPVGDPEIVFKFRHPDEQKATALDVRPKIAGKYRIKFKAEALPLKDQVGGYRLLYSHNCQFGLSQMHDGDKTSMATLAAYFPRSATSRNPTRSKSLWSTRASSRRCCCRSAQLDFGNGVSAKCDVALWRTRGEHKSLVGEFAFQVKFDRRESHRRKAKKLAAQFYITLQRDVEDWLALGVTKTGMVYRLKGTSPKAMSDPAAHSLSRRSCQMLRSSLKPPSVRYSSSS